MISCLEMHKKRFTMQFGTKFSLYSLFISSKKNNRNIFVKRRCWISLYLNKDLYTFTIQNLDLNEIKKKERKKTQKKPNGNEKKYIFKSIYDHQQLA